MRERERIEARLQARLEELVRTRTAMRRSADGMRGTELSHLDNHPGDIAGELHDEELDETEEIIFAEEERRIDEARRALAEGSYGTCRDCGRDIPADRLEAVPEAVRCLPCQRRFEGLQRQHPRAS